MSTSLWLPHNLFSRYCSSVLVAHCSLVSPGSHSSLHKINLIRTFSTFRIAEAVVNDPWGDLHKRINVEARILTKIDHLNFSFFFYGCIG